MNPIVPVKHIRTAVMIETSTRVDTRMFAAFSPKVWAALSPAYITLSLLDENQRMTVISKVTTSITGMYSHCMLLRDPTLHSYASAIVSDGAVTIMICVMELNRNMTAIPVRIMAVGVSLRYFATRTMMAVGINEHMNEFTTVVAVPLMNGTMEIPRIMLRVAPRNAPEDIPIVYGSARGFLKSFCMIAPATDSPAPISRAPSALGTRTSQT